MAFNLEMYPISYLAQYDATTKTWNEKWIEADSIPYKELLHMEENQRQQIFQNRNQLGLPAVSYTSQYGYGVFEGMKAYLRKDGKISIFRPDRNAQRFANSLRGLYCPVFPEELYVKASLEFIRKNNFTLAIL